MIVPPETAPARRRSRGRPRNDPGRPFCGAAARARRVEAGLRQEDVARALGLTRATVARWERGESAPRAEVLLALAVALRCRPVDLA